MAGQRNLAILLPSAGVLSETFIRRHCRDLLPPPRTVLVERYRLAQRAWEPAGPSIVASRHVEPSLRRAFVRLGVASSPVAREVRAFLRDHDVTAVMGEYLDHSHQWLRFFANDFRFFVHAHGYDVSERLRHAEWRRRYSDYRHAAGVITMSELSRRQIAEATGLDPAHIHVVPYGVDVLDVYTPRTTTGPVRCLAVGRMVGKKAPLLLLDAVARAVAAGADIVLEYVGDGPLLAAARERAARPDLAGRITLHGAREHSFVRDRMAAADLFLQHSRVDPETGDMEGLPVAILEAMGAGLPVVATRHAGIPEAVVEGATGVLVDEGDVAGMGDAIAALAADAAYRTAMGRAAWQRAVERFSWPAERAGLLRLMGLEP
jgi:glycosyltransferase involved in cell wall biosynthesis